MGRSMVDKFCRVGLNQICWVSILRFSFGQQSSVELDPFGHKTDECCRFSLKQNSDPVTR
jgi:hypothetical protein